MSEGAQVFTGEGITYAGLAGLKYNLRLEALGMKSKGGAIRPRVAVQLGLKKTAPHADFIKAIEERMQAILDRQREAL